MLRRAVWSLRFPRYQKRLERAYERMGVLDDPGENELLAQVRSRGFYVWPEPLPMGDLARLQTSAERLLASPRSGAAGTTLDGRVQRVHANVRLVQIAGLDDVIDRLFVHRPLFRRVAEAYYGAPQEPTNSVLQHSLPLSGPAPNGFGLGGFHFDGLRRTLKVFLYLEDCDATNGPLAIVPETGGIDLPHKYKKMRQCFAGGGESSTYYSEHETRRLGLDRDAVELVGPAGTLLFVDTRNLHVARPVRQGCRRVLVNYYKA